MKSAQLRIGNYVNYKTKRETMLRTINGVDIGIIEQYKSYNELHEPIPLTEQWLLDFGFVKYKGIFMICIGIDTFLRGYINGDEFSCCIDCYYYRGIMDEREIVPLMPIKYVHSLQNLFFALTGKELTK